MTTVINKDYLFMAHHQLITWINGRSIHNFHSPICEIYDDDLESVGVGMVDLMGECCPDLSCCHPEMKWAEELRVLYLKALKNCPQLADRMIRDMRGDLGLIL